MVNATPESLEERAIQELIAWLSRSDIKPGEPVPIRSFASRLGMSRTPLRSAVGRLHEQGVVNYHPRLGFTVATPTVGDLDELFDIRLMMEEHAIRRYFARAQRPSLETPTALAGEMAAIAKDVAVKRELYPRIRDLDAAFHASLVDLASSRRLSAIYGQLHLRIHVTRAGWTSDWGADRFQVTVGEHDEIMSALRKAELERAVTAVRSHIMRVRDQVLTRSLEIVPSPMG